MPEGIAQFGKRAIRVEQDAGQARVLFTDGSEHRCDLLIAADGIKSSIRDHVLQGLGHPLAAPRFSGTCAYRGMIDSQQLRAAYRARGVDEHLVDVPQMYLGLDAHIFTFPVKQGRLINVVAFTSDRSRPDPVWPSDSPWVRNATQEEMLAASQVLASRPQAVLEAYDAIRRPRACRVQRTSWEAGELYELRDPVVADNEQMLGTTLAERFEWLWDHDMQSDLQEARDQLGWKVLA